MASDPTTAKPTEPSTPASEQKQYRLVIKGKPVTEFGDDLETSRRKVKEHLEEKYPQGK